MLPPEIPNLPSLLRAAGYEVAYKGKWHLTHPSGEKGVEGLLGGWLPQDADVLARDYGFADWEVPDAGENAEAPNFGGGNAGEGEGWDEVYIRQVERWLGRDDLPGAVLPRRLAGQPPRRARLPGLVSRPAATRRRSSATSASSCRRPSTRTCAASRPSTR